MHAALASNSSAVSALLSATIQTDTGRENLVKSSHRTLELFGISRVSPSSSLTHLLAVSTVLTTDTSTSCPADDLTVI